MHQKRGGDMNDNAFILIGLAIMGCFFMIGELQKRIKKLEDNNESRRM